MRFKKYYKYDVYEDGRIYSHKSHKFLSLKPDSHGYCCVTLFTHKKERIKVHRLVALLFLEKPLGDKILINHKDGNKQNNHYLNLEWCNYYENNFHARLLGLNNISESNRRRYKNNPNLRIQQGKKISETIRLLGLRKGHNNARFKYMILDKNNKEVYRQDLPKLLGYSQSYIDSLIKECSKNKSCSIFDKKGLKVINIKDKKLIDYRKQLLEEISNESKQVE